MLPKQSLLSLPLSSAHPLASGDLVADRFELVREIGRGGMGTVWQARHVTLDVPCAVKFIEDVADAREDLRARFEREARAVAKLRSPNVVQILDHGIWRGRPYIAMELLEGEDLASRLDRQGRLSPAETLAIVADVARALAKARELGIVHRDLKPENVFLVRDGDRELAKVLDFGIAKAPGGSAAPSNATRTGTILGTPAYMSPEQADGTLPVDHRSDLWSLGVIAFRCLTGRQPFESEALGNLLNQIMHEPLPVPSQLAPDTPPSFDAFWRRAAARPVEERFQTADELVAALAVALGAPLRERLPTPQETLVRSAGSRSETLVAHTQTARPEGPRRARALRTGLALGALAIALGTIALARWHGAASAGAGATSSDAASSATQVTPAAPLPADSPSPNATPAGSAHLAGPAPSTAPVASAAASAASRPRPASRPLGASSGAAPGSRPDPGY